MARSTELTKDKIRSLIVERFADLRAEVDGGYRCETTDHDQEREYVRHLAQEHIIEVQTQRETGHFRYPVVGEVMRLLERAGITSDAVSADQLVDLKDGIARAVIEQDRLLIHRLSERLLPYQTVDPLFSQDGQDQAAPRQLTSSAALGPTLGDAVSTYLAEGQRAWSKKTLVGRTRQIAYLVEHLGSATPIGQITPRDIVSYRDALRRLRVRHKQEGEQTFAAKQTDNLEARISDTTVENLFVPCKAFFRWAKGVQGMIATNPAEDVRLPKAKKIKGAKSRRPFQPEELQTLFAAPVFTGMKAPKRRFDAGPLITKDGHYWIPILGFYTGARLGEIVQLHLDDVRIDGQIPYLSITEEGGAEIGSGDEKSVKSNAGVRQVPLHPDLVRLGFLDFVRSRKADKRKKRRLFWQIPLGADGQASTVFSKWFARLLDTVGLTDPTLVFHSFRHTAEDAARNALLPQYVIDRIIGHTTGQTSDRYGEGISLETAYEAVLAMKWPHRVAAEPVIAPCPGAPT